jgi:hypothetical protein
MQFFFSMSEKIREKLVVPFSCLQILWKYNVLTYVKHIKLSARPICLLKGLNFIFFLLGDILIEFCMRVCTRSQGQTILTKKKNLLPLAQVNRRKLYAMSNTSILLSCGGERTFCYTLCLFKIY